MPSLGLYLDRELQRLRASDRVGVAPIYKPRSLIITGKLHPRVGMGCAITKSQIAEHRMHRIGPDCVTTCVWVDTIG